VDLARRRPHPPARAPRAAGEPVRRGVVHALALYLAEGTHALDHADEVDDLLVLDGPIYPKELFTWDDRNPELGALAREAKPRAVVEKYVRLVERFVERDVPLAGFVKNPPAGRSFARWLGRASNRRGPTTRRFSPGSWSGERATGKAEAADPTASTTSSPSPRGSAVGAAPTRRWPPTATRSASNASSTRSCTSRRSWSCTTPDRRDLQAGGAVRVRPRPVDPRAAHSTGPRRRGDDRGPPEAVAKADELARIAATEKIALRRKFEERFDSDQQATYDDRRWGKSRIKPGRPRSARITARARGTPRR